MPLPQAFNLFNRNADSVQSQILAIGFGTFQPDPKVVPGTVKKAVLEAIRCGYRHIDTAYAYSTGKVEKEVGEAIAQCGIPREQLFIVTKLYVRTYVGYIEVIIT